MFEYSEAQYSCSVSTSEDLGESCYPFVFFLLKYSLPTFKALLYSLITDFTDCSFSVCKGGWRFREGMVNLADAILHLVFLFLLNPYAYCELEFIFSS